MAENEMRRRMMMESAMNLEVDLGNLVLDEQASVNIPLLQRHDLILTNNRLLSKKLRKMKDRSSCGTNVSMTKCLFSKKPILIGY